MKCQLFGRLRNEWQPLITAAMHLQQAALRKQELDELESEAVYFLREVASEFRKPALLFSGGKDSVVLLHLARKAFRFSPMPFPALHVDTGHNFPELLQYRNQAFADWGETLLVASVEDAIRNRLVKDAEGPTPNRNRLQSPVLLRAIAEYGFDAAIGGARRDEDRARAKERVFSHRDALGQWNPRAQRPELWGLSNTRLRKGEHFRVFPLSNWTELDIWNYVKREKIRLPSLYFASDREVFEREGMLYAIGECMKPQPTEQVRIERVRYRTIGDMTCTGAVRSTARTVDEVIEELATVSLTERGATRADDQQTDAAMEDRKREGYF